MQRARAVDGTPGSLLLELDFGSQLTEPARLRHEVLVALAPLQLANLDDIQLVVGELVTNAVLHGRSPRSLALFSQPGILSVAVVDGAPTTPKLLPHDPSRDGGRGMMIIDRLSRQWDVRPHGTGKRVSCCLDAIHGRRD